jgi:hypothetical protein
MAEMTLHANKDRNKFIMIVYSFKFRQTLCGGNEFQFLHASADGRNNKGRGFPPSRGRLRALNTAGGNSHITRRASLTQSIVARYFDCKFNAPVSSDSAAVSA